eukprot:g27846.t1
MWSLQRLAELREIRERPDAISWSAASSTLDRDRWQHAVHILDELRWSTLQMDTVCFTPKAIAWPLSGLCLGEIRHHLLRADVVTLNAAAKGSGWEKTLAAVQRIRVSGVLLLLHRRTIANTDCIWPVALELTWHGSCDQITLGACLAVLAKGHQWHLALDLLLQFDVWSLQPDEVSFNLAILACEKASEWQRAVGLCGVMVMAQVTPSAITYSSVVKSLTTNFQWRGALNVFDVRVDAICYNSAMAMSDPPHRVGISWSHTLSMLARLGLGLPGILKLS